MAATTSSWQPILQGPLANEAWAAVRAIARDMAHAAATTPRDDATAGDAILFWTYAAGALDDAHSNEAHEIAAERFAKAIKDRPLGAMGLYGGLWNAWVLGHVSEPGAYEEVLSAIDGYLLQVLTTSIWDGPVEFLYGLAGYGVYEIDRLHQLRALQASFGRDTGTSRSVVCRNLDAIVAHLVRLARRTDSGRTWFTPSEQLPPHHRAEAPDGYYNVGLAHGVPGVIGMLGRLAGTEASSDAAIELLRSATDWLWAQRARPDGVSMFPIQVLANGEVISRQRTAWCYGDPGVLASLWLAASHTGASTTEIEALALACAEREIDRCLIHDAALCHGSMGLAHLYNRFYHATGNLRFRAAAVRWFSHGLNQRGVDQERIDVPAVGGFLQRQADEDGRDVWRGSTKFLSGSGGIALALMAGLGREEPLWDRALLLDLPSGDTVGDVDPAINPGAG